MSAKLTIYGSGSSGNLYILDCGTEQLILECGLPCEKALKVLNYDIKNVRCALASHSHKDHARYIRQYQKYFKVYSTPDCAEKYDGVVALEPMKKIQIGGFKVMPLAVPHGDCECYSYVIDTSDGQRILCATDLSDFPYNIKGCTTIMLECNYIEELILDKMLSNEDIRSASYTHLELNACISVIRRLYSTKLMQVVLLHLSEGLSDINEIKRRFKSELGLDVFIAKKNMQVFLKLEEF